MCDVSLLIFDKNSCKIFSDQSSTCSLNKVPLALSVLLGENTVMKNKNFHGVINKITIFTGFNHMKLCCFGEGTAPSLSKLHRPFTGFSLNKSAGGQ